MFATDSCTTAYNGRLYFPQGENVEAESLCRQAMEIIQDEQGDDHPDFAAYANNLGRMLFNQVMSGCESVLLTLTFPT